MFDLEQALADWRRQMLAAGIKAPAPLEELEIHLRDETERQIKSGLDEPEAFTYAVQQIGHADALKSEFTKASGTLQEETKHFILTLAGIPSPQLATAMNTPHLNIEPGWATYLKATAFLMPAVFLWLSSVIFLFPKANEICRSAGLTIFDLSDLSEKTPIMIRAFETIGQAMLFLTAHGILVGGAIVLAFILLEWRSNEWPRYRRATVGVAIFLFNFAVLLSITLMVLSLCLAAPMFMHHVPTPR